MSLPAEATKTPLNHRPDADSESTQCGPIRPGMVDGKGIVDVTTKPCTAIDYWLHRTGIEEASERSIGTEPQLDGEMPF